MIRAFSKQQKEWLPQIHGRLVVALLTVCVGTGLVYLFVYTKSAQAANAALFEGIRSNDLVRVRNAIAKGANPNAHESSTTYIESLGERVGLVSREAGYFDHSALMLALQNPEIVKVLIRAGARVDNQNADGDTALLRAAFRSSPMVIQALVQYGADIHLRNRRGESPIVRAGGNPDPRVVLFLIQNGANVNAFDGRGRTALMHAAQYGLASTVKALLENGADDRLRDMDGMSAWSWGKLYADVQSDNSVLNALRQSRDKTTSDRLHPG